MPEALLRSFLAVQVAEAAANYAHADEPLTRVTRATRKARLVQSGPIRSLDDEKFWWRMLENEGHSVHSVFGRSVAITEWIARIPGLYWRPGSAQMRKVLPAQIEVETGNWRTYTPQGKSRLVSGGVGTLRFPPATDGFRLVTITSTHNASAGVPALVSPDVWDHWNLAEGSVVNISDIPWRPMPQEWAAQFPVIRGIKRGCLVLSKVAAVEVKEQGAPVQVHPFSIMEYWNENIQLHDFVYATGDTRSKGFRRDVSQFFESYRNDKGREGSYLTTSDIADPMWDATFADPAEMRASRGPQLRLIEKRAEEAVSGPGSIDALLRKLSSLDSHSDLMRLSEKAGIPSPRWSSFGISLGEEAARLVDVAIQSNKQQALLHAVMLELPQ